MGKLIDVRELKDAEKVDGYRFDDYTDFVYLKKSVIMYSSDPYGDIPLVRIENIGNFIKAVKLASEMGGNGK